MIRAVVPTLRDVDHAAGFGAVPDQHHAKGLVLAHAAADHVDVAGLEDAQRQQPARKQHRAERKQCESQRTRAFSAARAASASSSRACRPPKPPLLMISA